MKYSREYILRRAFDVFMDKGYDSASITVLQKELNMSRGALYRYFKNKDELFRCVIDEYFFKLYDRIQKETVTSQTVLQHIETMHRRQRLLSTMFTKAGVTHTTFLNYTALMIQAVKYYPNFLALFRKIQNNLISNWKTVLKNSINAGEVRTDINIEMMSYLFNNVSLKESSADECGETDTVQFAVNILKNIDRRKEILDYLYSLIKNN